MKRVVVIDTGYDSFSYEEDLFDSNSLLYIANHSLGDLGLAIS